MGEEAKVSEADAFDVMWAIEQPVEIAGPAESLDQRPQVVTGEVLTQHEAVQAFFNGDTTYRNALHPLGSVCHGARWVLGKVFAPERASERVKKADEKHDMAVFATVVLDQRLPLTLSHRREAKAEVTYFTTPDSETGKTPDIHESFRANGTDPYELIKKYNKSRDRRMRMCGAAVIAAALIPGHNLFPHSDSEQKTTVAAANIAAPMRHSTTSTSEAKVAVIAPDTTGPPATTTPPTAAAPVTSIPRPVTTAPVPTTLLVRPPVRTMPAAPNAANPPVMTDKSCPNSEDYNRCVGKVYQRLANTSIDNILKAINYVTGDGWDLDALVTYSGPLLANKPYKFKDCPTGSELIRKNRRTIDIAKEHGVPLEQIGKYNGGGIIDRIGYCLIVEPNMRYLNGH